MPDIVESITVLVATPLVVSSSTTGVARVVTSVPDNTQNQQSIIWSSSNSAIATVAATATGCTVTAIAPGTVQIKARIGTVEGSVTVLIQSPVIDLNSGAVAIENALKALPVGATFTLRGPTLDIIGRKEAM